MKFHKRKSLRKIIEDTFSITAQQNFDIYRLTALYLCRVIGAFDYQKQLGAIIGDRQKAKIFRLSLLDNSYLLVNFRNFVFMVALRDTISTDDLLVEFAPLPFCISAFDVYAVANVLSVPETLQSLREEAVKVETFLGENYFSNMNDVLKFALSEVRKYAKYVTYKKLRFVVFYNNFEYIDLENDLMLKAIKAFHFKYPVEASMAYLINYMKRAISNHAVNLCKLYTSSCRTRICRVDVKGEFLTTTMSENVIADSSDSISMIDTFQASTCKAISKMENRRDVRQILSRVKSKKKKFLLLMLGRESPGLTMFLRKNKYIPHSEDNCDYYASVNIFRYMKALCVYLHLDQEKAAKFLDSLKKYVA